MAEGIRAIYQDDGGDRLSTPNLNYFLRRVLQRPRSSKYTTAAPTPNSTGSARSAVPTAGCHIFVTKTNESAAYNTYIAETTKKRPKSVGGRPSTCNPQSVARVGGV